MTEQVWYQQVLEPKDGLCILSYNPKPGTIRIFSPGMPKGTFIFADDAEGNLMGLCYIENAVDYDAATIRLEPNNLFITFKTVIILYVPLKEKIPADIDN